MFLRSYHSLVLLFLLTQRRLHLFLFPSISFVGSSPSRCHYFNYYYFIYNLRIRTIQSTPLSIWYYSNSSRTGTRRLGQNKKDSVPSSSIITKGPDKISSFSSAHYCTRRWEFDFIIWKIKGDPFWYLSDDGIILAALFAGSCTSNLQVRVQVWTHESYQVQ